MFLFAVFLVFILDVGTNLPVVLRTRSLKLEYLKKPSIFLGDFIIIPLVGGYILDYFYSSDRALFESFSLIYLVSIGIIAITLAAISALRFKTKSVWHLPHGLFYVFMAFIVLLFLIGNFNLKSVSWWLVLVGVSTHLLLGYFFPKTFPKIK